MLSICVVGEPAVACTETCTMFGSAPSGCTPVINTDGTGLCSVKCTTALRPTRLLASTVTACTVCGPSSANDPSHTVEYGAASSCESYSPSTKNCTFWIACLELGLTAGCAVN